MKSFLPVSTKLLLALLFLIFSLTFPVSIQAVPNISDSAVSNITSSTATMTWTTDVPADSTVGYDTDPSYNTETRVNDFTYKTSHSITLTGLPPDTFYYYYIESNDGAGVRSLEGVFNTASVVTAAPTATPTVVTVTVTATPTPTPTATATPTPTPTPFVDRIAPNVKISTDVSGSFEKAPLIEGTATDSIGVSSVSFSTDDGTNWLPADTDGTGTSVDFSFTPSLLEDGNYEILARAIDSSGNVGVSDAKTLVIDRLPPRVGGNVISLGPLPLLPNEDGVIVTIPGLEQRITLSAVGGPTSIDLVINDQVSSLAYSVQTGLWTGALNLKIPGAYRIKTRAIDGAGNETERDLNSVIVMDPGGVYEKDSSKLAANGKVTVYVRNPFTRLWSEWDGKTFGQENPQNLISGEYQFFMPPGTYYLTIETDGAPKMTSKIFKINKASPLTADFRFQERKYLKVGPIKIPLPDFFSDKVDVVLKSAKTNDPQTNSLLGKDVPKFVLPSTSGEFDSSMLSGERSVISFIGTWAPSALEQMPILDEYYQSNSVSHAIVASQESQSKIIVFQSRGGYETDIVIDADGELVEKFEIASLPTHFFLDRRGIIKKIVAGVLTSEEMDLILSEI